ncbi:MAG: transposase, partial [Hydrogenibacillus schlegelii]|nr:transposase [Hydrogenibacillus schlegelii]
MSKATKIKSTLQKTKERRETQRPVVFQLKLQNLSRKKEENLRRAFGEAKWFYNWLVSDLERLNVPANKVDTVEVKVGDVFEERRLVALGSQVKQEIADRLKNNLRALAKLKKNGHKVGRLKPKRFVNSIPLKQYGITYSLDFARSRVRIQKLGSFRVLGLHQIPPDAEIASAVLVRKPSGYYLHVTCYLPREYFCYPRKLGEVVGGDFGVETKITLSNGIKIDFEVRETPRLKRLQRRLARAKKGSRNREKIRLLLRREYEKLNNRRKDAQNKVLAFLRLYEKVVFQDDGFKGWAALFGRQVHSSGIGGMVARLRNSLETPIPVERFEPTS